LHFCLSVAAGWALLGATACALTFAISNIPAPVPDGRSIPGGLYLGEIVLAAFMLPLCAIIPAPLLVAGCIHLRRARASLPWTSAWAAAAAVGLGTEARFLVRFAHMLSTPFYNLPQPSWHALDFAIAFTAAGVVMASALISATWSASRRTPAV